MDINLIKRICMCYFSPCNNVRKIVTKLGNEISDVIGVPTEVFDFTSFDARKNTFKFDDSDLVIIGSPVYAGRIPNKIMPFYKENIIGDNAICICAVSYGNRSYDDALGELVYLMENNGMDVIAACAIPSEHSFTSELATQRPDENDLLNIGSFARIILDDVMSHGEKFGNEDVVSHVEKVEFDEDENNIYYNDICVKKVSGNDILKLNVSGTVPPDKYYTPLKEDGNPAKFLKAVPKIDEEKCIKCGKCKNICPMGSINDSGITDGICIKCQACVYNCAGNARYFDDEDFLSHVNMLKKNYSDRKEAEYFIRRL